MGVLEKAAKRDRALGVFQSALLSAVALGGVVILASTIPNAARLLKYFPSHKKGARFNFRIKSVLTRLTEAGYITFENHRAKLTDKGQRFIAMQLEQERKPKPKRWDQRWRVVIFDIPEKRKNIRIRLWRFMTEYGFTRLQDSVWVYPFDCEDLIALVKADFRIGADVLYLIVEKIEHDKHLREHFQLPS